MATITLQYDARNSVAKKFIEVITSLGLFSVVDTDKKPNAETIQALKDAKAGRNTIKPKDPMKFIDQCMK
ncbi:MAG: hypothetical protein J5614_04660 [Paludibacteraceae bacterium]|nr:hypothetical protein [Paludibacteraceae bacterium]